VGSAFTFRTPVQTKAGSDYYDGGAWGDLQAPRNVPTRPTRIFGLIRSTPLPAAIFPATNWKLGNELNEIIPRNPGERRGQTARTAALRRASNFFNGAAPYCNRPPSSFQSAERSYTVPRFPEAIRVTGPTVRTG